MKKKTAASKTTEIMIPQSYYDKMDPLMDCSSMNLRTEDGKKIKAFFFFNGKTEVTTEIDVDYIDLIFHAFKGLRKEHDFKYALETIRTVGDFLIYEEKEDSERLSQEQQSQNNISIKK